VPPGSPIRGGSVGFEVPFSRLATVTTDSHLDVFDPARTTAEAFEAHVMMGVSVGVRYRF
jgi:hypothetical protein